MVVNSPFMRPAISWGGWHWGGPLGFPWYQVLPSHPFGGFNLFRVTWGWSWQCKIHYNNTHSVYQISPATKSFLAFAYMFCSLRVLSANVWLVAWVGDLDSWDPLMMKGRDCYLGVSDWNPKPPGPKPSNHQLVEMSCRTKNTEHQSRIYINKRSTGFQRKQL